MVKYKDDFDDEIKANINSIGNKIYSYRVGLEMNPNELAKRAGITRPYLLMLETGLHNPSFAVLCRIARGLGVTPAHLMPDEWLAEAIKDSGNSLLYDNYKASALVQKLIDENNSEFRELIELMKKADKLVQSVFGYTKK